MPHAFLFAHRPARVPLHCSKMAFDTRGMARRALGNMTKEAPGRAFGSGRMTVYLCPLCELWHIGHKPIHIHKEAR